MKVPIEWLKEFVPIRLSPERLAERLTMTGTEVAAILKQDGQSILDLEITPNRADCLSIFGVAREVAAITGQRLKPSVRQKTRDMRHEKSKKSSLKSHVSSLRIAIEDKKGCSRYIGRLITGVNVQPSPAWMQSRLIACGARPINNLVDITNYVLYELGQPLHAFDFSQLNGGSLQVRGANPKETIQTLDGTTHALSIDMVVIADAKRAVAVAGVMGGVGSEVTESTDAVLLESALFDPMRVRQTARRLGLASESSYRFERGVDPEGVVTASERAAELIQALAGGQVVQVVDVGVKRSARTLITIDCKHLNGWLGTQLAASAVRTSLARLSCRVASSGESPVLRVSAPSFRRDLTQPVDLYEEIARIHGYDTVSPTVPKAPLTSAESPSYTQRMRLRRMCAGLTLTETINWSLVSEQDLLHVHFPVKDAVRLANPLSQDHAYLRPTLLVGLLSAVRRNLSRGVPGVRFFEIGAITHRADAGSQRLALGVAVSGLWSGDWRGTQQTEFFHLKGVLESLARQLGVTLKMRPDSAVGWSKPGEAIRLYRGDAVVGEAGSVAASVGEALDLEQPVWYAQVLVDPLLQATGRSSAVQAPVVYPPVKRDLSLVLGNATAFDEVALAIREASGTLGYQIRLIDRYTGKPVPSGKHSLTFSIEYRHAQRTLTAEEADALHRKVGALLIERFGAALR